MQLRKVMTMALKPRGATVRAKAEAKNTWGKLLGK